MEPWALMLLTMACHPVPTPQPHTTSLLFLAIAKTPPPTLFSQVTHTVALGTIGESNYHFGVTYVGTKQLSPTEVRFL